jgi:deazaflavin-dependent oxidoreductase (nitroreductase family)
MLPDIAEPVPYDRANAFQRGVRRVASTAPMAWLLARVLPHIDQPLARIGGPGLQRFISSASGLPMVTLTTTGARSGQPRTLPLLSVPTAEGLVLVGSNFGQQRTPAWVFNLRANPACRVAIDGPPEPFEAVEVEGEQRARLWREGLRLYPGWASYERRAANRTIAVFLLESPAPPSP